ncbi:2,3-diaminopropionate biosynthesis protein SbnA [Xenorhabdus bovienii]|uniref:2,3-diaminopropionate biosynthesis protein SbnA n=1 Tax=Xenorhabdus bovienii TaxID=40576 RepID=UPI0023B22B57|nr:2,3-diaminopropionate biosynthesis protein SbnA [Xenorhabdus bovienii]MDE9453246.1 2,3-diaminopropionate biosynthesis protein SbnA [Xenorhabdus bovienii]
MLVKSSIDLIHHDDFLNLSGFVENINVYIKIEGLNIGSSIKIKAAKYMIESLENEGKLRDGAKIIESSSGNLGLALSIICACKKYNFTCVSDPNISPQTARMIRAYGAELIIVNQKDNNGGYLGKRLELIAHKLDEDQELIWINQYENRDNVSAHYNTTGPEILNNIPSVDYLFIGAGTTGTLGGVSRYIKEHSPHTKIIAIDTLGSVTFNGKAGKRKIPGLGTSKAPYISKFSMYDDLIRIPEENTIRVCHELAKQGLMVGGSTGTVLCGVRTYKSYIEKNSNVVVISPDMGDRYIDTIYNPQWVFDNFPGLEF